jgi:hypothetical protein
MEDTVAIDDGEEVEVVIRWPGSLAAVGLPSQRLAMRYWVSFR